MKMAIVQMIRRYTDVEKQFQIGHYDKVVTTMRALNKDNVQKVVDTVFAHTQGNLLRGIVIWSGAAWFVLKMTWTSFSTNFSLFQLETKTNFYRNAMYMVFI